MTDSIQNQPSGQYRVIDTHAHIVLEETFGAAGKFGPRLGVNQKNIPFFEIGEYQMQSIDYRGTIFMDLSKRIDFMGNLGIDLQLLSPNPLTMFHKIDASSATKYCQIQNDSLAKVVENNQDYFLGSAALPMQDPVAACKEAERAAKELGLSAISTGTDFPFSLDDPILDDFYKTLVELDIPLFLHPASTGGAKGPDDARLERFDLSILLGYPYEETLAVATLILGGVTLRHPKLDICISHGGGAIALLWEKFELLCKFREWAPDHVKKNGFRSELKKLWFDSHVEGNAAQNLLVDLVGKDRLVYGTNLGGWDTPKELNNLAKELTGNAEKLLRVTK